MRPFFVFFFISPTHLEVNTFTKPFYPTTFEKGGRRGKPTVEYEVNAPT